MGSFVDVALVESQKQTTNHFKRRANGDVQVSIKGTIRAPARARAVWTVEYRTAVARPRLPFKKAKGGNRRSSHNTSGWLK